MASLRSKIKLSLDESRLLVLGTQILLGFDFNAVLEPGFARLPRYAQLVRLAGLTGTLITNLFLLWPATYHQIVFDGNDHPRMQTFTNRVVFIALIPLCFAFGLDIFTAMLRMTDTSVALTAGVLTTLTAVLCWYVIEFIARFRQTDNPSELTMATKDPTPSGETPLMDKIEQLLTESRVIIPGAQALLGFQLTAMFTQAFESIPSSSKTVHALSMGMTALSTILLMTPAAYHRIVENGEDTERFYRFARKVILWSMLPLANSVAGNFYVVLQKVTQNRTFAIAAAATAWLTCLTAWFGFTYWQRSRMLKNSPGPQK